MSGHSIRLRLTAWYAGSILLLLLGGTWAARTYMRQSLEGEFARSQEAAAVLVRGFFRAEVLEYRLVEGTIGHIVGELAIPDRHIHFVRPDGRDYVPPADIKVMPLPQLEPPLREIVRPLDPQLAPGWQVRLTSSAAPLTRQLAAVDRRALLAIPVGVLVAVVLGWVLTGRTLRPVARMAEAADRITAGAGGRVPVAVPDDELGRLGTRFNALLDRLDEALARQRRFLADAAHELRTPIARARGAGELALSSPDRDGDREALEQAQHELGAMSHLVDELLELARADAAGAPAELHPLYLDDVVAEVARAFEPLARTRGQRIALEVPEEVPARGDAVALQRLVGILVDNALRYSPAGGVVRVAARRAGTAGEIVVRDDGIGIPPEERARLFERFFRGARARQEAPDGSGLGLAIAQAIAQRHGARIEVEPGAERGTEVRVRLPA